MKKIILTMTMLSLSIACYCQNAKSATQVSFGRYGSDCSSGRGACSFTVTKTGNGNLVQTAKKISAHTVELQIDKSSLTKEEQLRIFGMPLSELNPGEMTFFIQDVALLLTPETLGNLQIDPRYTQIAPGNYPMTVTNDKIKILFTLQVINPKD